MPMTVSDVGRTLLTLDEDVTSTAVVPLLGAPGQQWSVLTVAEGETWSTNGLAAHAMGFVTLEGFATCEDASGRQSIASGHVVAINAGESVTITNESNQPFRALLAWTGTSATGDSS